VPSRHRRRLEEWPRRDETAYFLFFEDRPAHAHRVKAPRDEIPLSPKRRRRDGSRDGADCKIERECRSRAYSGNVSAHSDQIFGQSSVHRDSTHSSDVDALDSTARLVAHNDSRKTDRSFARYVLRRARFHACSIAVAPSGRARHDGHGHIQPSRRDRQRTPTIDRAIALSSGGHSLAPSSAASGIAH
jgi:hypothetical protein